MKDLANKIIEILEREDTIKLTVEKLQGKVVLIVSQSFEIEQVEKDPDQPSSEEKQIMQQQVELRNQIDKTIETANKLFKKKAYLEAKELYINAKKDFDRLQIRTDNIYIEIDKGKSDTINNVIAECDERIRMIIVNKPREKTGEQSAPAPEKKSIDEKAEAENKKKVFDHAMQKGIKLLSDKKYQEAENEFKAALELFPDDKKAKEQAENAAKWVKAMKDL